MCAFAVILVTCLLFPLSCITHIHHARRSHSKRAYMEVHHAIVSLESYCLFNYSAIAKIAAKHDKLLVRTGKVGEEEWESEEEGSEEEEEEEEEDEEEEEEEEEEDEEGGGGTYNGAAGADAIAGKNADDQFSPSKLTATMADAFDADAADGNSYDGMVEDVEDGTGDNADIEGESPGNGVQKISTPAVLGSLEKVTTFILNKELQDLKKQHLALYAKVFTQGSESVAKSALLMERSHTRFVLIHLAS